MREIKRTYFVIDMKSFFASVECAELGLDAMTARLVVADKERSENTVCLAVSPAMKELGVKNRCRLFDIPKDIDYILVKPRMKKYIEYAAKIYGIYLKYIDKRDIHVYSIDECIIDATDYLKIYKLHAKEFAMNLMNEINDTLHIPSSAGIGTNMYLAKIALDITAKKSPNRIGWLTEEIYRRDLWKHRPITDFWQVSKGTANRLAKYGIFDMEGITKCDEDILYKEFGVNAELLIDHAWGKESCLMSDIKSYKSSSRSFSNSQILPYDYTFESAKKVLQEMVQEGCYRLAESGFYATNIHIYVGYGGDWSTDKGSVNLGEPTDLFKTIWQAVSKLLDKIVGDKTKFVRKLGIDYGNLTRKQMVQESFFADKKKEDKESKLTRSILKIKDKFGKNSLVKGIDLTEDATQVERNKLIGGHNG